MNSLYQCFKGLLHIHVHITNIYTFLQIYDDQLTGNVDICRENTEYFGISSKYPCNFIFIWSK